MPRIFLAAVLVTLASVIVFCQTPTAEPRFEVASIKPSDPSSRGRSITGTQKGDFRARGYTLKDLIRLGWDVRSHQITGGPKWLDNDRYDVDVKPETPFDVPGPDNEGQRRLRLMVQSLLADRFKLKLHAETKEMSVYFLVVSKNGPTFKPSDPTTGQGPHIQDGKGLLIATSADMGVFSRNLAAALGVPVIDRTNLKGNYDLKLEWTPDEGTSESAPSSRPSIFTAVQEQLGLRLQPGKAPVAVVIVDSAEKASAN